MIRVGALARVPSLIFLLAILMSAPPALSQWSAAVNLGPSINTQYSELHLAISADELLLPTAREALAAMISGSPSVLLEMAIGNPRQISDPVSTPNSPRWGRSYPSMNTNSSCVPLGASTNHFSTSTRPFVPTSPTTLIGIRQ